MNHRILASFLLVAATFSCTDEVPTATLHLESPMDMAMVCFSADGKAQPLSECNDDKGTLKGFVVTAELGQVAVLDLRKRRFEDTSAFIPGVTSIPLGARSIATVAALDGSAIYTANADTKSIFRMDSKTYALTEQKLSGRPVSLVVTSSEIIAALPDSGALARIAIDSFGSASALQTLSLNGGSPYDLAVTEEGSVAYVGHAHVPWVSVVDLVTGEELHQIVYAGMPTQAEPAPEVVILPEGSVLPACLNGLDDDGDGLKDYPEDPDCLSSTHIYEASEVPQFMAQIALSADQEFVYVLNLRDRVIAVINTVTLEHVDVHAEDMPGANPLYRQLGYKDIVLSGVPIDVTFATAKVTNDEGESNTRTRAYVASATGEVHAIDVEDDEGERVHRFRDADEDTESRPVAPLLFIDDESIPLSSNRRNDLPSFGEYLTNKAVVPGDESAGTTNYGIQVVGDEYTALFETWSVEHQGTIIERAAKLGYLEAASGDFVTPESLFCTEGVQPSDQLIIRFAVDFSCGEFEGRAFAWTIDSVTQNRLSLVPGSGVVYKAGDNASTQIGDSVGDMDSSCFGQALSYEIRVPYRVYTVTGTVSGRLHGQGADSDGECIDDPNADSKHVSRLTEWTLKDDVTLDIATCPPLDSAVSELYEGQYFENHAVKMRMIPGCKLNELTGEVSVVDSPAGLRWRFTMDSAWVARRFGGMGTPRSLRWLPVEGIVYAIDSGQEKIVEIETSSDKIRSTIF